MRSERDALVTMLDSGSSPLWTEFHPKVRARIDKLRKQMDREIAELKGLQGDVARRTIMAPVERSAGQVDTRRARELIRKKLGDLHLAFVDIEKQLGSKKLLEDWTQAWGRLEKIAVGAAAVSGSMASLAQPELEWVRERLSVERVSVQTSRKEVDGLIGDAESLSVAVTQKGFSELEEVFSDQIMRADIGIVDVYWNEKKLISEEIELLRLTKEEREKAQKARFDRIRRAMGD